MNKITKAPNDFWFLDRVDRRYSEGATIQAIASEEGFRSVGAFDYRVRSLGFAFDKKGGLRDALMGRPFREWVTSGDLTPAIDLSEAA